MIMKLLIADDNKEIRKILKSICSHIFFEILECDDGDLAVEIYKDKKPDWVLMDIKMNRMDGIEATKIINEEYPDAKIIVVSQYDDKNIIDAAMNSGAVEFVGKDDLSRIEKIIEEKYK